MAGSWHVGDPSIPGAVIETSLDGLAVLDRELRYVMWNPAMERYTGKRAAEVLGRNAFDVFPFLVELGLDDALRRALRGEVVATEGTLHVESDGTRKMFDRWYLPRRDDGGDVANVI